MTIKWMYNSWRALFKELVDNETLTALVAFLPKYRQLSPAVDTPAADIREVLWQPGAKPYHTQLPLSS